jgi:hypothetical protein
MIRTQIQLTEEQSRILKQLAKVREVSVAELVRHSIDYYIHSMKEPTLEEKYERSMSIVGKYRAEETDIGRNHDRYLAEIYGNFGE